jgi:hypothetical protein
LTNVSKNDVVEWKKIEKNDEMKSSQNDVDENRVSSNNSFNLKKKEIASFVTFQRSVVFESIFDSKSSFISRRNSRRSSQTSFRKKKRSIFNENENVESSVKRRRRSKF